jgi:CRP-like cAMP-binding protein
MNRLIASLPADARGLLEKDLQDVQLKKGDVLYRIDEPITHLFFPHGGLVSFVVVMESGEAAEVSLIGREGLVCSGVVLDVQDAIDQATVEVGTAAFRISSTSFIRAYRSHDKLRTIVNRHHAMFIAEGRQSTACNAVHNASERLCRWLANAQDRSGMDNLEITQEFLARMVGVGRSTINQFCGLLHSEGIIDTSRGHIKILQPEALRSRACECYRILSRRFAKLFPDRPGDV